MREESALCLSGGGFRATLFHLGGLWRLNELGWLKGLNCFSLVSGGSILGGWLAMNWGKLEFDSAGVAGNFAELISPAIRRISTRNLDASISLKNFAANCFGATPRNLERALAHQLFGDTKLADLPTAGDAPRFIFNTASLNTGVACQISREELHDARLGRLPDPDMSLARAVAACCALPPFLSPVRHQTDPTKWHETAGADLYREAALREQLTLTDAGVMDAVGLEPVWREYRTLLVSDASQVHETWRRMHPFWIKQLVRSISIRTRTNSELRRDLLRELFATSDPALKRQGAYWSHAQPISEHGDVSTLCADSAQTRELAGLRTRLLRFTDQEQGQLINWGYAHADAALRTSVAENSPPSTSWPVPEHAL